MSDQPNKDLTAKVERTALYLLGQEGKITYPALLRAFGVLDPKDFEAWRAGRVPCLEKVIRTNLTRLSRIQKALRHFARRQGLSRQAVPAPRGRRYCKTRNPFIEEEYGAVYRRAAPQPAALEEDREPELPADGRPHAGWRPVGGLIKAG